MALYETRCTICGRLDDQIHGMPRYGGPPCYDACPCGGAVEKIYTSPADHSDNTFKPRWSDNLSTGGDPVYVKTKDEYRHLKSRLGLTEHEPGMSQDKRRNDKYQADKARDSAFKKMFGGLAP